LDNELFPHEEKLQLLQNLSQVNEPQINEKNYSLVYKNIIKTIEVVIKFTVILSYIFLTLAIFNVFWPALINLAKTVLKKKFHYSTSL